MILRNDLQELSFELAEKIREKIQDMRKENRDTIQYILSQTDKKIERDREAVERNMIQEAEYRLNQQESKKIKEINSNIVKTKLAYVEKLIRDFKIKTEKRIENDMSSYFKFLKERFAEISSLFDEKVFIQFNQRDRDYLKENEKLFPNNLGLFEISDDTIENIGGFFVKHNRGKFTIDFTFDSVIEDKRSLIYKKLMSVFPVFEVNIENAIEIYEKRHSEK